MVMSGLNTVPDALSCWDISMYLTILFTIITKLEKSTRLPEVGRKRKRKILR